MVKIWYKYPEILLKDLNEFIPNNNLSKSNNINAIARFAIYFSFIILILKQDIRWLIISLILLFISYYLDIEPDQIKKLPKTSLIKSTPDNPYMNYIINDRIGNDANSFPPILPKNILPSNDPTISLNTFQKSDIKESFTPLYSNNQNIAILTDKLNKVDNNTINYDLCITSDGNKSCSPDNKIVLDPDNLPNLFKINDKLKKEIRKNYRSHLKFDSIDMWGQLINDRNYYTSPNIELVNEQTEFARWCYTNDGGSGKCKTDGNDCVKDRDIRYNRGRISFSE